eukprot:6194275-Pleurochrysis_carterae.AAC.5
MAPMLLLQAAVTAIASMRTAAPAINIGARTFHSTSLRMTPTTPLRSAVLEMKEEGKGGIDARQLLGMRVCVLLLDRVVLDVCAQCTFAFHAGWYECYASCAASTHALVLPTRHPLQSRLVLQAALKQPRRLIAVAAHCGRRSVAGCGRRGEHLEDPATADKAGDMGAAHLGRRLRRGGLGQLPL